MACVWGLYRPLLDELFDVGEAPLEYLSRSYPVETTSVLKVELLLDS